MNNLIRIACVLFFAACVDTTHARQTQSAFTYQGRLKVAGVPVTDACDVRVSLWNAVSGGVQLAGPQEFFTVSVDKGLFVITPDFGFDIWDGDARFLQLAVRCPAGAGLYTTLAPRQPMTAVPYALFAQQGGEWAANNGDLYYVGGNVGIGTNSPQALLNIEGDTSNYEGSSALLLMQKTTPTVVGADAGVVFQVANELGQLGNYNTAGIFDVLDEFSNRHALALRVTASGASTMNTVAYLRGDGNVGIGTSGPGARLDVEDNTPNNEAAVIRQNNPAGYGLAIIPGVVGDRALLITDGAQTIQRHFFMGSGLVGLAIGGGNVGIGTGAPTERLEVAGNLKITGQGSKPGGGSWANSSSDRASKRNIAPIEDGLAMLRRVQPKSFEYIDEYYRAFPEAQRRREFGVIAQEFQQVLPDWTMPGQFTLPNGNRALTVDATPLTFLSVAAIKELDAKNAELETTVQEQRREIAALKERLDRIESLLSKSGGR